jgi:hypothetical protein
VNPLYATTKQGTVGELLVQLRLLEHDIQAAPPVKDSGNDLIAIRGRSFRAIQVRTTTTDTIDKPRVTVLYHILAIVRLPLVNGRPVIRNAEIFLFSRDEVKDLKGGLSRYRDHLLSQQLLDKMFDDAALNRRVAAGRGPDEKKRNRQVRQRASADLLAGDSRIEP